MTKGIANYSKCIRIMLAIKSTLSLVLALWSKTILIFENM